MAIKRSSKVDSSFSPSSMTDLIFLLLVFFILATTLINPNNAVKLTLPSSSSQEGDPSVIALSIVGDRASESGYKYVINRDEAYNNLSEVAGALRVHFAKYEGVPQEEKPYISLRCDEKVTVDALVEIIDLTREEKYKMVLATKDK
ncbi:MAG: biopolymer transporter ExbD [Alistipes sp.]|jgi:biopolymer transport protein ExbD|nr:biopolymer transporter ExbD [Alistipes sp.]MBO7243293.1 biopolymer transporter ExbD [Alistipes sp.]